MRVISLYQPYATLMVLNRKKNETRSWSTDYRGLLGIHAAKSKPAWCRKLCEEEEAFVRVLGEYGLTFNTLPRGGIIGSVMVRDMVRTEVWEQQNGLNEFTQPSRELQDEWWFGDYSRGRWAWITDTPLHFNEPIPEKGSQGFWTYPRPLKPQPVIAEAKPAVIALPNPVIISRQLKLF